MVSLFGIYRQSPVKSPDIKKIIVVTLTFLFETSPLHRRNLHIKYIANKSSSSLRYCNFLKIEKLKVLKNNFMTKKKQTSFKKPRKSISLELVLTSLVFTATYNKY